MHNLCRSGDLDDLVSGLAYIQETAVHHDAVINVVEEYHHKHVKHFSYLYLNNFELGLMVEHRVKNLELATVLTATSCDSRYAVCPVELDRKKSHGFSVSGAIRV